MNLKKNWKPVVDRFEAKLSAWKATNLSFGGRTTLIKSVLSSLPLYYFSLFKAPCGVIEKLEQIRRKFLWGAKVNEKKIHWVSWSSVIASKEKGGLGIGSLKAQNLALLLKWWWKYHDSKTSVWKKVIESIHNTRNKPFHSMANKSIAGVWCNITKLCSELHSLGLNIFDLASLKIGLGSKFLFWKDLWIGDSPLQSRFPLLYSLEGKIFCLICDRVKDTGYAWEWKQPISGSTLFNELCELLHLLGSYTPNNNHDSVRCIITTDEQFTVQTTRGWIDDKITTVGFKKMTWLRAVPLKVNCFIWKAGLGRLPVAKALHDRGMCSVSITCKVCNGVKETVDHALVQCPRTVEVMRWIFEWCGISVPAFSMVTEILDFASNWGNCPKKRSILMTVIYCTFWQVWKARNDKCFNNHHKAAASIAGEIISLAFSWIKYRSKALCNLVEWNCCPFPSS